MCNSFNLKSKEKDELLELKGKPKLKEIWKEGLKYLF